MSKRQQLTRIWLLAALLVLAFMVLGYWLVNLQIVRHTELVEIARGNTVRKTLIEARRGDILDVKGNPLASTIIVKTVCADPTLLGNRRAEVAHALAPLLQLNEESLAQTLAPRLRTNSAGQWTTNRYVPLKQKVPVETWAKIESAMTNLSFGLDEKKLPKSEQAFYATLRKKSIFSRDVQLRIYPNQNLAAHVLGYASAEEREVDDTPVTEIVGKEGIEQRFNEKLAGVRGWRLTENDSNRREMVPWRQQDVEPSDGLNVVLTIDSIIQHTVESALAEAMEKHSPISVSGVVIRPRTGEILAMATLPNFDPNNPGAAPADARRNRVIADIAEPGSTFKIVPISAALNENAVKLTDVFDCEHGRFAYAGRVLHDHESYGHLTVEQIITKSSNIGAAKIGIKLGDRGLAKYISDFGFGTRTGIPLQGELGGIVHPVNKWGKVSLAQIPMGHGIAVTRLQMIMAMCAIANDGWLMRPMLINRLEDRNHHPVAVFTPQRVRRVLSDAASRDMIQALKTVPTPDGTAAKAALEHYTVAGKTGTAQKVENGRYVSGKYFSSFIGFFPADNPEICISITFDEPKHGYYGGQVAAPVFRQIAESAANDLQIPPDIHQESIATQPGVKQSGRPPLKTVSVRVP